jgi:beta-lactamase class A
MPALLTLFHKFFNQISLKKRHFSFGVLIAIIFLGVGYSIGVVHEKNTYRDFLKGFKTLRENSEKYSYINPLIGNISAAATDVGIYTDIKESVVSYFEDEKSNGGLEAYSFYFRDLNSGLWFGAHETDSFLPASLFKLPVAIAAYKQAEDDPSFLKRRLVYTDMVAQKNQTVQLNAESTLEVGESYTVEDLIEKMLAYSDNGAKDLILQAVAPKYINRLFELVSLTDPAQLKVYTINARKYALFLRILYGSSYLNNEDSELLMSMLVKSDFKDGLVAGVPYSVKLAHKFGTYEVPDDTDPTKTLHLLHDCGVVYHLERPYLICVMTKGKDIQVLYTVISHISQMIYTYQDTEHD